MNIKTLIAVSLFLPLAGCSTVAAAKKTGVKVSTAAECTTKICLQTQLSSEQIDEKALGNGLTQYTFRMQKRQGSYLRSLGYGIAAVGTLGLSELATTPLEGALQNDKQFAIIADCDSDGNCGRTVLVEHDKPPVVITGHTDAELLALDAAQDAADDDAAQDADDATDG